LEALLTPSALAATLGGLSEQTLANWRYTGIGGPRFCKIGKRILYDPADVRAWLESRKAGSTSEPRP
jgi:predicted DNA-binding transcriptional regulator AlpA